MYAPACIQEDENIIGEEAWRLLVDWCSGRAYSFCVKILKVCEIERIACKVSF